MILPCQGSGDHNKENIEEGWPEKVAQNLKRVGLS